MANASFPSFPTKNGESFLLPKISPDSHGFTISREKKEGQNCPVRVDSTNNGVQNFHAKTQWIYKQTKLVESNRTLWEPHKRNTSKALPKVSSETSSSSSPEEVIEKRTKKTARDINSRLVLTKTPIIFCSGSNVPLCSMIKPTSCVLCDVCVCGRL